jgi:replicative DNA helicase
MLYRNKFKCKNSIDQNFQLIELIIAKQRNGPIGSIKLKFDEKRTKFFNEKK